MVMDVIRLLLMLWCLDTRKNGITGYSLQGREFVLSFNYQTSATIENLFVVIINSGQDTCTISVKSSQSNPVIDLTDTVASGQSIEVSIPSELQLSLIGIEEKAIMIQSTCDVTVIGYQRIKYSNDAFIVYPIASLGYEYYALTYCESKRTCTVSVVASEANTFVTIILPNIAKISILFNGVTYQSNDIIYFTLNYFETFLMLDTVDLSGTRITADKPVAVYSGNDRSTLHYTYVDHFSDQVIPAYLLGTEYLIANPGFKSIHYIKIVTSFPDTSITITSDVGETVQLLQIGEHITRNFGTDFVFVQASDPVTVAHFVFDSKGNTAMYFVTPVDNYDIIYDTYGIGTFSDNSPFTYINYVVIIIEERYKSEVMIDDVCVTPETGWISKTIGSKTFASGIFQISHKSHVIAHLLGNITFWGYVIGTGGSEVYATALGIRNPLNIGVANIVPVSSSVMPSSGSEPLSSSVMPSSGSEPLSSSVMPSSGSEPLSSSVMPSSGSEHLSSSVLSSSSFEIFSLLVMSSSDSEPFNSLVTTSSRSLMIPSPSFELLSSLVMPTSNFEPLSSLVISTSDSEPFNPLEMTSSGFELLSSLWMPPSDSEPLSSSVMISSDSEPFNTLVMTSSNFKLFSSLVMPSSDSEPFNTLVMPSSDSELFSSLVMPSSDSEPLSSLVMPSSDSEPFSSLVMPLSDSKPFSSLVMPSPDSEFLSSLWMTSFDSEPLSPLLMPSSSIKPLRSLVMPSSDSEFLSSLAMPSFDSEPFSSLVMPSSSSEHLSSLVMPASDSEPLSPILMPSSSSEPFSSLPMPSSSSEPFSSLVMPASESEPSSPLLMPTSSSKTSSSLSLPSSSSETFSSLLMPSPNSIAEAKLNLSSDTIMFASSHLIEPSVPSTLSVIDNIRNTSDIFNDSEGFLNNAFNTDVLQSSEIQAFSEISGYKFLFTSSAAATISIFSSSVFISDAQLISVNTSQNPLPIETSVQSMIIDGDTLATNTWTDTLSGSIPIMTRSVQISATVTQDFSLRSSEMPSVGTPSLTRSPQNISVAFTQAMSYESFETTSIKILETTMSTRTDHLDYITPSSVLLQSSAFSSVSPKYEYATTTSFEEHENVSSETHITDNCLCKCSLTNNSSNFQRDLSILIRELKLNKTDLSSYQRKLISADDNRMSAKFVGYVGIIVMVLVSMIIVIPDIITSIRTCRMTNNDNKNEDKI